MRLRRVLPLVPVFLVASSMPAAAQDRARADSANPVQAVKSVFGSLRKAAKAVRRGGVEQPDTSARRAAPSQAVRLASLDSLIDAGVGAYRVVPDSAPTVIATLGLPRTALVGSLVGGDERASEPKPTPMWVRQADATGLHPFAEPGGALTLYWPATQRTARARVSTRRRFRANPDFCGDFDADGWGYLVNVDPADRVPQVRDSLRGVLVLPGTVVLRKPAAARAGVRAGYTPTFKALLDRSYARITPAVAATFGVSRQQVRRLVYGETGLGALPDATFTEFRGPAGPLAFVSTYINDDLSDHGQQTRVTALLDMAGRVVAQSPHEYELVAVGDLNADGTDELVFDDGVAVFQNGAWAFPMAWNMGSTC